MSFVKVMMWEGRTKEQKSKIAKVITEAVVKIGKTTPEHTTVVFEDVPKENWAIGGVLSA